MGIEVVDTNVWANMDKIPPQDETECTCILACIQWGAAFSRCGDNDKLAVDTAWKILSEYRRNIQPGGLAEQYLNRLLSQPMARLEFVQITFDENGHAVLPARLTLDASDRKFAAVALTFEPPVPIINSTDTDWEKAKPLLAQFGLSVQELCPSYVQERSKGK
jgi:hypothetical protein